MKIKSKKIKALILPLFILICWYLGSESGFFNSYILPSPVKILKTFLDLLKNGMLIKHLLVSFYRVFLGFTITFIAAFLLALLIALNDWLTDYIKPTLEFIRHIPPIALIPILILWLGIGENPKITVIILATFFPVFLNTLSGISNCDSKLKEVGDIFGLSKWEKFYRIILPQALPSIIVGMQIALGYSWRSLIGAELIAASSGIGYMIIDAEQLSRPDIIIVGVITIGIFGYLIDYFFFKFTQKLIHQGGKEDEINYSNQKFN